MLSLRSVFSKLTIRSQTFYQPIQCIHLTDVDLRARKGTRERREKLKKKNKIDKLTKITKVGFIPRTQRSLIRVDKHQTNDWKRIPTDDAYPGRYYRSPRFSVTDAIRFHKECHDPTMYDALNSPLNVSIEMNMIGDKPTRLVSNFQKLVPIKYPFDHGQERTILAFAKEEVNRSDAIRAGATTVGGSDLVRSALKGNIRFADYQFIVAHPDIMPEMLALRGLLKKKFPSPKSETLGVDLGAMVAKFMNGLAISGKRDDFQENYGVVNTCIGNLLMPTDHLVENFNAIMSTVNGHRPNRGGKFITRVYFTTAVSTEKFIIDPLSFPFEDYERPEDTKKVVQPKKSKKKPNPNQFERTYTLFRAPI